MVCRFRTALMWLLLLALPLQGVAAATMLGCGPNHHRNTEGAGAAGVHQHQHAGHDGHSHDLPASDVESAAADVAGDPGTSSHALDKGAKSKCSVCAACCIGAALPAAALLFARFDTVESPAALTPASHVGFFTDGPDRPPRISLG